MSAATSETSASAYSSIRTIAPTIEAKVSREIAMSVSAGMTCDEVEQSLGLSHQCASARIRSLALAGKITDHGERRKTRSGRNAVVWFAVMS